MRGRPVILAEVLAVELISVTLMMDKELRVAVGMIRASSVFRFP
jgi:hypothetical protein